MFRTLTAGLAGCLLLAACGGGSDGDGSAATDAPLATAIRIDDAVDARTGEALEFASVSDPVPVAVGDTVRTDASGFAEVAWFDGSVMRLDVDTEVEVLDLADAAAAATVRVRMGLGRTWHRVRDLPEGASYVVETSVGVASVRGTAFVVTCTLDACTFTVLEGVVEVTPLGGDAIEVGEGESVVVGPDGVQEPVGPTAGDPFDDPWLVRNNDLDVDDDRDDLRPDDDGPGDGDGVLATSPEGVFLTWTFDMVLTDWENGGERRFGPEIGSTRDPADEDYRPSTLEVFCVEDRCRAFGQFVHIGYGTSKRLAPDASGVFDVIEEDRTGGAGCDSTETFAAQIRIDGDTGGLSGEFSRTADTLEKDNCRLSSAAYSFTAGPPERQTCAERSGEIACLALQAGEDFPLPFDRPTSWG